MNSVLMSMQGMDCIEIITFKKLSRVECLCSTDKSHWLAMCTDVKPYHFEISIFGRQFEFIEIQVQQLTESHFNLYLITLENYPLLLNSWVPVFTASS